MLIAFILHTQEGILEVKVYKDNSSFTIRRGKTEDDEHREADEGTAYRIYDAKTGTLAWQMSKHPDPDACGCCGSIRMPQSHLARGSKFVLLYTYKQEGPLMGIALDMETGNERTFDLGYSVGGWNPTLHFVGLIENR